MTDKAREALVADLAGEFPGHFGRWGSPDVDDVRYFYLSAKAVVAFLENRGWQFSREPSTMGAPPESGVSRA